MDLHISVQMAMSAVEVKKAQSSLTCPVCYQLFKNPKYLPCYHFYCEKCLEKMQVQSKITCPECRKEVKVPVGGVKELHNNFYINHLVDDLILNNKIDGKQEIKCEECDEEEPVVSFCPECNSFLCHTCNNYHLRNRRYRGHAVVPLNEPRSNKETHIQVQVKTLQCKEHDEELKYYCETCNELVCVYCTVKKHNGHQHDSMKQMATKHRNALKKITNPIEGMIKNLSKANDNIENMMKKTRRQGEEVEKRIDQYYNEQLSQKLMRQKDEVKQKAHDAILQKEKAMQMQLEDVALMQAELRDMKELTDALEQSTDLEALLTKQEITDRVKQFTNAYKKAIIKIQVVESAAIDFLPTEEPVPVFGHLFANVSANTSEVIDLAQCAVVGEKVEFTIITKDSNGGIYSGGGSLISICMQLKSFTGDTTTGEVRDNKNSSYTVSFIAERIGEAKLSIYINGEQIKGSPYNIVVKGRNYQTINKPTNTVNNNGTMGKPCGIAFSRNGLWAVADFTKHCVYIFDDQDQLIRTFGCKGSENGQFSGPRGVAFDQKHHLYVADYGNHRVQKFDTDGNYLMQFGCKGTDDGQLNGPYGVAVHKNNVYITDYYNKRISMFQTNGEYCISFGADYLGGPSDIAAISANDLLLVADFSNSCIYTFTMNGHYVGKFCISKADSGRLTSPYGLATDLNGFIIITDTLDHCVLIFNQDRNTIHSFGTCGSADDQFNNPYGIAFSPNGSIYVTDRDNKRIQIFSDY